MIGRSFSFFFLAFLILSWRSVRAESYDYFEMGDRSFQLTPQEEAEVLKSQDPKRVDELTAKARSLTLKYVDYLDMGSEAAAILSESDVSADEKIEALGEVLFKMEESTIPITMLLNSVQVTPENSEEYRAWLEESLYMADELDARRPGQESRRQIVLADLVMQTLEKIPEESDSVLKWEILKTSGAHLGLSKRGKPVACSALSSAIEMIHVAERYAHLAEQDGGLAGLTCPDPATGARRPPLDLIREAWEEELVNYQERGGYDSLSPADRDEIGRRMRALLKKLASPKALANPSRLRTLEETVRKNGKMYALKIEYSDNCRNETIARYKRERIEAFEKDLRRCSTLQAKDPLQSLYEGRIYGETQVSEARGGEPCSLAMRISSVPLLQGALEGRARSAQSKKPRDLRKSQKSQKSH